MIFFLIKWLFQNSITTCLVLTNRTYYNGSDIQNLRNILATKVCDTTKHETEGTAEKLFKYFLQVTITNMEKLKKIYQWCDAEL